VQYALPDVINSNPKIQIVNTVITLILFYFVDMF